MIKPLDYIIYNHVVDAEPYDVISDEDDEVS